MSNAPWEFSMDEDAKFLIGFLGACLLIGCIFFKGCSESTKEDMARKALDIGVVTECIKAGHPVLECEKLK